MDQLYPSILHRGIILFDKLSKLDPVFLFLLPFALLLRRWMLMGRFPDAEGY